MVLQNLEMVNYYMFAIILVTVVVHREKSTGRVMVQSTTPNLLLPLQKQFMEGLTHYQPQLILLKLRV